MKHVKGKYNLYGILALVIAVAAYILIGYRPVKIDFTDNKIYTLSQATEDIVNKAEEPIKITYLTSEEVPQSFIPVKQTIEDLLKEYDELGSNVDVAIEFPQNDQDVYKKTRDAGIQPIRYNVVNDASVEISEGYSSIIIEYKDKKEILPRLTSALNNEIIITSSINSMVQTEKQPIDILIGKGTKNIDVLKQLLGRQYRLSEISVDEIGKNKTLLIVEPTEEFTEEELQKIDSFVVNNGNLIVLHSKVNIDEATLEKKVINSKLDTLLTSYGITITPTLVGDFVSNEVLTYAEAGTQLQAQYPFWLKIADQGINNENAIMSGILYMMAPWASALQIDESKENIEIIAETSERSYAFANEEVTSVHPREVFQPSLPSQTKHVIGAVASGEIQSAFGDEKSTAGNIVVFGASKIVSNNILPSVQGNASIISNVMDTSGGDQSLLEIRGKAVQSRPLTSTRKEQKNNIKMTSIVLSIIIAGGSGAIITMHRKLKYKNIKKGITTN